MKSWVRTAIAVATLAALVASPAFPQQAPAQGPIVQKIRGNLYFVRGGMAFGAFYVHDKGVIVVDAKMTVDASRQTVAEIAKVTPLPITHILITHSDGDHVNGLTAYPKGLQILASEGTKREMEEAFKDEKMAALREYLPNRTYGTAFSLRLGTDLIELIPVGPAHTSGDTIIYFPAVKAAFIGDLAFLGRDPLIHRQKQGTSFGYARALKTMLAMDAETYLSGHNEPLTKADLQGLLATIEEKQGKVKALIAEGKSLDEIKKALGVPEAPAGGGGFRRPGLVETIYLELTEKK